MILFALSPKERRVLEELTADTDDAHTLRRALALLWLDEGEGVEEIAEHLRVSRHALYKWVHQFQLRHDLDPCARVVDGARSGRSRSVHGVIDPLIDEVIEQDPRKLGYRATVWTAPLLREYLQEVHHLEVSRQSVSLAIARVRLRWQRPRHCLARRPERWRQAKGGSNVDSKSVSARSF